MTKERDVFLCHTGEDKISVLRPLVAALKQRGITYWYDEAEILWGDSVTEKVNVGLRLSRFVLVVFSETFLTKNWPQRELNAALNVEASTGEVRVLPLLYGTPQQCKMIKDTYPILNDKACMMWDTGVSSIVNALKARLSKTESAKSEDAQSNEVKPAEIVIPQIRRQATHRDKDRFLRETFLTVKEYFKAGAREIHRQYPEIELEMEEVNNRKFLCSIYRHGAIVNKCKIWVGGLGSTDNISYSSGSHLDVNNGNSVNDWLSVDDDGPELGFRTLGMGFGLAAEQNFTVLLPPQKVGEYLWLKATESLKYV